jgi:hypothetical protein
MPPEYWVEARLRFSHLDGRLYERLLLTALKPSIRTLEASGSLLSFHFLFEPEYSVFRIRAREEDDLDHITRIIRSNLEQVRDFVSIDQEEELFFEYRGESEHFGDDGWQLAQKMFEMGTKLAIAVADPEFRKSLGFNAGKIVHCMMNPNFGSGERIFYLEQFIGRIMVEGRKNVVDETVENEARAALEAKLQEWKHAQLTRKR